MSSPTIVETPTTPLSRLDRCGAAARTRVNLPSGGELLFCGHHTRAHLSRLRAMGAVLSR